MRGSTKERLLAGCKPDDAGCWIWQKGRGSGSPTHRYGRISHEGVPINAHRASWIVHRGPIPSGIEVLHKCDVPLCVNPEHLFLGTKGDNMRDMAAKGRALNNNDYKTHCPKGHAYSAENTWHDKRGKRYCVECRKYDASRDRVRNRKRMAAWRAKNPEKAKAAWTKENRRRAALKKS